MLYRTKFTIMATNEIKIGDEVTVLFRGQICKGTVVGDNKSDGTFLVNFIYIDLDGCKTTAVYSFKPDQIH